MMKEPTGTGLAEVTDGWLLQKCPDFGGWTWAGAELSLTSPTSMHGTTACRFWFAIQSKDRLSKQEMPRLKPDA